jgi:hypothetical protein
MVNEEIAELEKGDAMSGALIQDQGHEVVMDAACPPADEGGGFPRRDRNDAPEAGFERRGDYSRIVRRDLRRVRHRRVVQVIEGHLVAEGGREEDRRLSGPKHQQRRSSSRDGDDDDRRNPDSHPSRRARFVRPNTKGCVEPPRGFSERAHGATDRALQSAKFFDALPARDALCQVRGRVSAHIEVTVDVSREILRRRVSRPRAHWPSL